MNDKFNSSVSSLLLFPALLVLFLAFLPIRNVITISFWPKQKSEQEQ